MISIILIVQKCIDLHHDAHDAAGWTLEVIGEACELILVMLWEMLSVVLE
jgi:hypothetical protein